MPKKTGKFELADGGTILLDEISEMDLALQAKLLRVLQEGEVDRVGGKAPVPIDVRVVATTNRDLKAWVDENKFRADLYYRLNVIPLTIPPLRKRPGDFDPLVDHFVNKYSADYRCEPKPIAARAKACLKAHHWPGNVRELENIIARGLLLAAGPQVEEEDLFLEERAPAPAETPGDNGGTPGKLMTIREMEQDLIHHALIETNGNRTHAAKILGISVRTLRNKLAEYKEMGLEAGRAA